MSLKKVARPDGKPAGRYGGIELVNIRRTRVGRFSHRPDRRRGSSPGFRYDFDERTQTFNQHADYALDRFAQNL